MGLDGIVEIDCTIRCDTDRCDNRITHEDSLSYDHPVTAGDAESFVRGYIDEADALGWDVEGDRYVCPECASDDE